MKRFLAILTGCLLLSLFAHADTEIANTNIYGTVTLNSGSGVLLFPTPNGLVPLSRKFRITSGTHIIISPNSGGATTNGILIHATDGIVDDSKLAVIGVDKVYACSTGGVATVDYFIKGTVGSRTTASVKTLSISPTTLTTGFTNTVFTNYFSVAGGGTAPYFFSIISGAFSNGLSMMSTGLVSGTVAVSPLSCGNPVVQVTDAVGNTGSATIMALTPGLTVSTNTYTYTDVGGTNSVIVLTSPTNLVFGTLNTNAWLSLVTSNGIGTNTITYVATDNSTSGSVARTGYLVFTSGVFSVRQLVTEHGNP